MVGLVKKLSDTADELTAGNIAIIPNYQRDGGVLHRSGLSSPDKLVVSQAALATAAIDTTGSLEASHTYNAAYAPGNEFGTAGLSALGAQATAADATDTKSVDITIPQVVGAAYYDVFLSEDVAPKWVGRVTEAQRAAGAKITAVGTITSPAAGVAAGKVRVDVIGTGIATSNAVFSKNVAYVLPADGSYIPLLCTGRTAVDIYVNFGLDDLRAAPTLELIPLVRSKESSTAWYTRDHVTVLIMAGQVEETKQQVCTIDVLDVYEMIILIGAITGRNATVQLWAEMV